MSLQGWAVTDDGPIDHLANVFTGLVVTDDGPDDSLPGVPLGFQPLSPSEAISSIQSFVNSVPKRTALPTRKERHASTLSRHFGAYSHCTAVPGSFVAAGKLLRSVKASKNDKELAKMWDEVHAEALALDKLVDCVGAIVPKADVEMNEAEVEYNTEHHFEDPIGDHDTVSQIVILFAIISNVVIRVGH
ncbi:hypothetical protein B0H14DRAFT_3430163 [Mycena olivaceomarginata]|nr:hypothetical protein B0H14DRAFT_3430163 [Mycena olivaceomarginata]